MTSSTPPFLPESVRLSLGDFPPRPSAERFCPNHQKPTQRWFRTPAGGLMCAACMPPRHLKVVTIELTAAQLHFAEQEADARYTRAKNKPRKNQARTDDPATNAAYDLTGVLGELVLMLAGGFPIRFTPNLDRDTGDVNGIHVRARGETNGRLFLHKDDPTKLFKDDPQGAFVFVRVLHPPYVWQALGWCLTNEGTQRQYWDAHLPHPCYAVPAHELRPMHTLYRGVAGPTWLESVYQAETERIEKAMTRKRKPQREMA